MIRFTNTALIVSFFLSTACSEYELKNKEEETPVEQEDTGTIIESEVLDCSVSLAESIAVPIDETCTTPEYNIEDPWNVEIEWQWTGLSGEPTLDQVMVAPIVGNLTDDDGDGHVTEQDIPDIVVVVFDSRDGPDGDLGALVDGRLIAIDGQTGAVHWQRPGFYWKGGPVIADVDSDGIVEVVAVNDQKKVEAVNGATGATEWISLHTLENTYPHLTVADLMADGQPEVIADNAILDGRTGALHHHFQLSNAIIGRMPAVGDIDLDGRQEVIIANECRNADGSLKWSSPIIGTYGHWSAILNYDTDPQGEVVMIGSGQFAIHDADGSLLVQSAAGSGQPGPPCVADFDGDGQAEMAWADSNQFRVFELDGSVRWSQSINDASGLAACSGYDVNGDGAYEVLFADEHQFYIMDGATGSVLYSIWGHASGTIFEFPVVADIDNDGSAEIVISSNNFRQGGSGWAGITVLGHLGGGWAKSGPTWNVHDFAVTNINQDGSVPTVPDPPWTAHNVYRARPTHDALAIDMWADVNDICFAACLPESTVRVAAQVFNQGPSIVREGTPVSLYRRDGNSLTFIAQTIIEEAISPGGSSTGFEFKIKVRDLDGADALVARADDWGTGHGSIDECEEWNNGGIEWTDLNCVAE